MEGQHMGIWERTEPLVGAGGIQAIQSCNVLVCGVGGVGGYVVEALSRAGVGKLTLVDHDVVSVSNRNRQIIALHSTLGKSKVKLFAERISDINPQCAVTTIEAFLVEDDVSALLAEGPFDYVVDAIDTVSTKLRLLSEAAAAGIPCVSSMGAGGRLDPSQVRLADIYDTEGCPLAKRCRTELRQQGVKKGRVLACFSSELPQKALQPQPSLTGGKSRAVNGTISYIPSMYGLMLAGAVVRHRTCGVWSLTPTAAVGAAAQGSGKALPRQTPPPRPPTAASAPGHSPPKQQKRRVDPSNAPSSGWQVGDPAVVTERACEHYRKKGTVLAVLPDGVVVRFEDASEAQLSAKQLRSLPQAAVEKAKARADAQQAAPAATGGDAE
eukprot:TRINITY_DN32421_c0_g1_i1.p1 TRINITY_DN32421_c0_g1~~TRINITY_DN32421_c0_g1_i1.p1  ORF type:complete len:382 (+),score=21.02 TRINITY_DN32421_c0_g1_i1:87-1232(+)